MIRRHTQRSSTPTQEEEHHRNYHTRTTPRTEGEEGTGAAEGGGHHYAPRHHSRHSTATRPDGHAETTHTTPTHPHPVVHPMDQPLKEGQRLTPDAPHNGARDPPLGTSSCHAHSAQRRLARAHAFGPVLGPHAHTTRAGNTRATEAGYPPQGRAARRGRAPDP